MQCLLLRGAPGSGTLDICLRQPSDSSLCPGTLCLSPWERTRTDIHPLSKTLASGLQPRQEAPSDFAMSLSDIDVLLWTPRHGGSKVLLAGNGHGRGI